MPETTQPHELSLYESSPRLIDTVDTDIHYSHGIESTIIEHDVAQASPRIIEHSMAQAAFDLEKLYALPTVSLFEPTHL